MSVYIPLIRTTRWIDLSPDHKKLRLELEQDALNACIQKKQLQPIMLQGAFGIGKTNSLYYLFHYGWCKLKTPTFFISLGDVINELVPIADGYPNNKIPNNEIGQIVQKLLVNQIELLKSDVRDYENLYFPEWKDFKGAKEKGNIIDYLEGFEDVKIIEDLSQNPILFNDVLDIDIIREALESDNRPLLLIDEFESKFYELKKKVESFGGGILTELFNEIVHSKEIFYLIIGNGPASGYEIAKERGDNSSDSETAANRRLKTKSIPFPTSNLLQRSFLKDDSKGYINFIWWLSRCRPGHIMKLRDALGSIDVLSLLNTNELITQPIFKEPIDEGGEAVSYLKTQFFNELNGRIQAAILGKVISEFQPIEFEIKDYKQDLRECVSYFLCSSERINTEKDLIPALRDDLYSIHLKKHQEEGKFDSVNYIEHIQPYLSFILSGISDAEGNIAFGMINDSKPDEVMASTFLIPLLELTYDFISLYQDDFIKETRESLDFLLNLINKINLTKEAGELEEIIPNTFDRFEKCKLFRNDKVFLQLSLYAIRESIEQPIGSPKLKYKNEQTSALLEDVNLNKALPLIFYKEGNLYNYFIPAFTNEILDKYLEDLQKHLYASFYDKFHEDGDTVLRVIYFEKNEKIDDFRKNLLYKDGDTNNPEPIYSLNKIDVVDIDSYQLNFGGQIKDYIDSVSQIGIIGVSSKEPSILNLVKDESILDLSKIIKVIGDRPWTEKKEIIRTIEHYRKLLFDGENSTFKSIHKIANEEYKAKLNKNVCSEDEFKENVYNYYYIDKIINDDSESYEKFTANIALLYLFENKRIKDSLKQLLELCKSDYKFDVDKEDLVKGVNYKNLLTILTKNTKDLDFHFANFDLNSSFLTRLTKFTEILLNEDNLNNIDEYYTYLKNKSEVSFIKSYHNALGGYLLPELTESLYNLTYLRTLGTSELIASITKDLNSIETSLGEVRVNIVSKLDEIISILDESESFSSYPEKLNKAIKGIALIKKILDKELSASTLIIINSIIKHFNKVVNDSELFLEQLEEVYDDISEQKSKVDDFQEEIEAFYKDPLTERLLGFTYTVKRTDNYLWKKQFLNSNLKNNKEEYDKLLNDLKRYANPFTSPTLYSDRIKYFNQCLITIYNKLNPGFEEMVENIKKIKETAESTTQLQDYIKQLLTRVVE